MFREKLEKRVHICVTCVTQTCFTASQSEVCVTRAYCCVTPRVTHVYRMAIARWDVGRHWIDFGIDGWRLDVPNEINDDSFWQECRGADQLSGRSELAERHGVTGRLD